MKKALKIFSLLIVFLIMVVLIFYLTDDKDFCLDTAICREGLEVNTKYGFIKISKENCLKYGWAWDDKRKECNMKAVGK